MDHDLFDPILFSELKTLIDRAFEEDFALQDITTSACISPEWQGNGAIVAKQEGVIVGLSFLPWIFNAFDPRLETALYVRDGARVVPGQILAHSVGPAHALLSVERTTLNLLQQLSGVATLTARCVEAVCGTSCQILDTRKTVPGMRSLQKYAVRMGGAANQRMHLSDRILIKNNHLFLAARESLDALSYCLQMAKTRYPEHPIQIEISRPEDLELAIHAGAKSILLDNMNLDELSHCVTLNRGRAFLEASGGMTLETIGEVARTGVNAISMGALTHSAPALDLSMRIT